MEENETVTEQAAKNVSMARNAGTISCYRDAYLKLQAAFTMYMEAAAMFEAAKSSERVFGK